MELKESLVSKPCLEAKKIIKVWQDQELRNLYVFVWFNFPYIFSRRMRNGELEKYGISDENAKAILHKIKAFDQQGPQIKVERLNSDSELSTFEHSLGKRSPNNRDDFLTDIVYDRPWAKSDSFDCEFECEEIGMEENFMTQQKKEATNPKLRFLGKVWYRVFK